MLVTRRGVIGAGLSAAVGARALPAWARVRPHRHRHRRHRDELPHPDRPIGEIGIPQLETIVLVMLENHSADNILGLLPRSVPARRHDFDGLPVDRHGRPIAANPNVAGKPPVFSYHAPDMCPSSGLTQNWNSSHRQYNNGRNDGFVTNAGSTTPMSYFTAADLPVTYALASHFPLGDRYFSSVLGQTLPNRRYYFSGTSSGQVNDDDSSLLVSAANGTIFDRLDAGKVDWTFYYDGTPSPFYFPNFRDNPLQVAKCVKNTQFFADAAAGKLPRVAYVEQNGKYQSEGNPQNIAYGEAFLRSVAEACMHSPQWGKLALLVTYDEHGGYYDHVPPPAAVVPDEIPPDLTLSQKGTYPARFDRYGFRVPFTVVSPWGQPRYVSHRVADHTSILAFLEHSFNLPPMTHRDAAAWDLRDLFDLTAPQLSAIELPEAPSIDSTTARCEADGTTPPTPQSSVLPTP